MAIVGYWHGAGSGFIVWGIYHGVLLNLEAWLRRSKLHWIDTRVFRTITIVAIMAGWALFYNNGLDTLWLTLHPMFGIDGLGSPSLYNDQIPTSMYIPSLVSVFVTFSGFAEAANLQEI